MTGYKVVGCLTRADVCRARQDLKGGAWCPAQTISAGVREWLEINLHTDYRVTAAETMGR